MSRIRIGAADEVPQGRTVRTDAGSFPLLVSHLDEGFFAIEAICSHAGGRLEDGDIADGCVTCPVHGAIFSLRSGKAAAETGWAADLKAFAVIVEDGALFVELPDSLEQSAEAASPLPASVSCRFDFDPMAPAQRECPFEIYRRAREEAPVFYSERFDLWVVTRYEDIVAVLKDPVRFSSAQSLAVESSVAPEVQAVLDTGYPATPTMVTADPPVHTRFRELVSKAFTSRRVAAMEPRMRQIAHRLIDSFHAHGHADLVRQFAYPFPMEVIAEILGVPSHDMDKFKQWSDDMSARFGPLPLQRQIECARSEVEFQHYFAAKLEERRKEPRHDLLTDLLNARVRGEAPLNMAEMLSILKQLLIGGNETSTNLIGSMVLLLLNNRPQLELLLHNRALEAQAVEEALRLESPVQGLFRTATRDCEIGGVRIPKGAHLELLYASGNRDSARFDEAEAFNLSRRDSSNHMAFGFGIHFCIGAPLARCEARIALAAILDRLPHLRLSPGQQSEHHPHFFLRGLKHLQIEWDV